ncbi:MAG: DNA replication complex GINS protein PSF2 [Marteilia pararefringens]
MTGYVARSLAREIILEAASDIPDLDETKTLLKDVFELRLLKLKRSISQVFLINASHAMINNVTSLELNIFRSFLDQSLDLHQRIN